MNTSTITSIDNPDRLESYLLEKVLERGSISVVYLSTCTRGRLYGRKVAIKAFSLSHPLLDFDTLSTTSIRSLHHPALISVHSSFTVSGFHYRVLEFCEGGSICRLINHPLRTELGETSSTFPPSLSEAQLRPIVRRVVEGLAHLHSHGIVHGDIRPHNVFITGDGRIMSTQGYGTIDSGQKLKCPDQSTLDLRSDPDSEVPHTILCKKSNYIAPCSYWFFSVRASMELSHQGHDLASGLLKINPRHRTPLKVVLAHTFLDPSLPEQSLTNPPTCSKGKKERSERCQGIKFETMEAHGSAPSTISNLNDGAKQDSKNKIGGGVSYPSVSIPTSAVTVKATLLNMHEASSRPRLYPTSSSVLAPATIQDAWRKLSSRQLLENDKSPYRSASLTVAESTELESRSLKTVRKALGEVGNLRRPFWGHPGHVKSVVTAERMPGFKNATEDQAVLTSGLPSPTETHLDQSLLRGGGPGDTASLSPPPTTPTREKRTWHYRQKDTLTLPSMLPYEHPIPIPRTSFPKSLQVTPLLPQTYKVAHGQLVILPSLNILVDLREGDRRAGSRGNRVLCVSPDGQEIKVYEAPHLSTPCILSEPRETWNLDELPESYWESYTFASKYLESVKRRTPWMVWYTPQAQFSVMSNRPKGDIHASFPCPSHGLKEKRYVSGKLADSFVKLKIKFSRQQGILELSRYAPSYTQRGRGEWISKSEAITAERLKLGGDLMLNMTPEERQGLVCLIEGVKLAEAAEEIYTVARPRTEEKNTPLGDVIDHSLKPDGTRITGAVLTPQSPEAFPMSDTRASRSTPISAQSENPLSIAWHGNGASSADIQDCNV
ncbi:kinase-like domain-containing protein [Gautieria morchelliformis]|nr:kinase-like domain-containing protein [Gautieria morchelliformis]